MSVADYEEAKRIGTSAYRKNLIQGKNPYLVSLEDIISKKDITSEKHIGITEIPVDMIIGTRTKGRQKSFAVDFMPLLKSDSEFAQKWSDLYESQLNEGIQSPIKVFEYLNHFYVEEGNKRVSVMKYVGASLISADVTRLLPVRTKDKDIEVYYEFVDFYKETELYGIYFSEPGCFSQLADFFGEDLQNPWSASNKDRLNNTFSAFKKIYFDKGGNRLNSTPGDAFLIYIKIYGLDGMLTKDSDRIGQEIKSIWNEFLTESINNVSVIKDTEEIQKSQRFISFITDRLTYTAGRKQLCTAFIYYRSIDDSSWNYAHELGRNYINNKFKDRVRTIKFENCDSDAAFDNAIYAAREQGANIIFTTTPLLMESTIRAAVEYPDISFFNCSINLPSSNVVTYYGRMYEAKFLMGAVASSIAENHKIAYIANYPVYGAIANINAFALGAAIIDPKCRVKLIWASEQGVNWRKEMQSDGIQIASGLDLIRPAAEGREYGIFKINDDFSITNIGMPIWNWGSFYEQIIGMVIRGTLDLHDLKKKAKAVNLWWGFKEDVIDFILSQTLSPYTKRLADLIRQNIISGILDPFGGDLFNQTGELVKEKDIMLGNREVMTMDWLNDNIDGEIPSEDKFNHDVLLLFGNTAVLQK